MRYLGSGQLDLGRLTMNIYAQREKPLIALLHTGPFPGVFYN